MPLIPAILAQDETAFRERLALVEDIAPLVQIDVMDGAFVPNRTWFDAAILRSIETPTHFELHLMVKDPARYIEETRDIASVVRLIWHIETTVDHATLIARCHALGKEAGLAINPRTPVNALAPYADALDEILAMGGEPGFSGHKLEPAMIERVRELHARWPDIPLGFDIGVSAETIPLLREAGVSLFCAASAIFDNDDPHTALIKLDTLSSN